jgi:plasmid stabilization system protein ParE
MRLIFSSLFEEDFAELVLNFATKASPDVATRFEHRVYRLIETLLKNPEMGRLRPDLNPPGIRSFRILDFDRYLLFYRIEGENLILLRLRYGGMNLQALFLGSD